MPDLVCAICGADYRFDQRCNPMTHARMDERAKIVAYLRRAPLNGPAETVYADAIERGAYEGF